MAPYPLHLYARRSRFARTADDAFRDASYADPIRHHRRPCLLARVVARLHRLFSF